MSKKFTHMECSRCGAPALVAEHAGQVKVTPTCKCGVAILASASVTLAGSAGIGLR